ncbi:MAG: hypothetical protein U5L96_19695 [Owenweeksia sp.]|nr:hypothetical protein [Owenweeksia sp.]
MLLGVVFQELVKTLAAHGFLNEAQKEIALIVGDAGNALIGVTAAEV